MNTACQLTLIPLRSRESLRFPTERLVLFRHGCLHHLLCRFLQTTIIVNNGRLCLVGREFGTSSSNNLAFWIIIHISVLAYVTPSTSNGLSMYHCDRKP